MESLSYIVAAQLCRQNTVRAVVVGIGSKSWVFSKARAEVRCHRAYPGLSAADLALLVERLAVEAEATIAPIRQALGATVPKRKLTAAQVKAKMRRRPDMRRLNPDAPLLGQL